jgi:hypothetical protein
MATILPNESVVVSAEDAITNAIGSADEFVVFHVVKYFMWR